MTLRGTWLSSGRGTASGLHSMSGRFQSNQWLNTVVGGSGRPNEETVLTRRGRVLVVAELFHDP